MISEADLSRMSWPARRRYEQRMKASRHLAYRQMHKPGDLQAMVQTIREARGDLLGLARISRCRGCGGWLYVPEPDPRYDTRPKPCACTLRFANY